MQLGTAGNTQGPALQIIELQKGYTVLFDCNLEDDNDDYVQWIAVKDGNRFYAESAEALLGLIIIYETFGDQWRSFSNSRELLDKIFERDVNAYLDD